METPTVADRLRRIADKLDRLRRRDTNFETFGSPSHRFELLPPLSEGAVVAWERRHGVRLPDGYRAFLMHLGDGGAGPGYGLYPLAKATEESAGFRNDPAGLFPLTAAQAAHVIATRRDGYRYHTEKLPHSLPGVLCVNHAGCHHYYFLVTTGELRGTVWYGSDGWSPCSDAGGRPESFLDWYESWLDVSLKPGVLRDSEAVLDHPEEVTGLNFTGRGLTELPVAVARMHRLESLDLTRNELRELPEWVGDLPRLTRLSLFKNKLTALPESVGRLDRLESFSVAYNALTVLPDAVGRLRNVRFLQLNGNKLTGLPESIGGMAALETLHAAGNRLAALPDSLGELAHLRDLDLGRNQLASLPDTVGGLIGLRELTLNGNPLDGLPDGVGGLPRLWKLDLFRTGLCRLPPAVARCPRLSTLYLGHNPGLDVGDALRVLAGAAALRHLNLSGNGLSELPDELAELTRLETLDLSHNAFDRAPEVLRHLPNLTTLRMKQNPLPAAEQKRIRGWLPGAVCWFR